MIKRMIEKAVEGGYDGIYSYDEMYANFCMIIDGSVIPVDDEKVIFSHDFLKAFFNMEDDGTYHKGDNCEPWEYHAQQLVLSEDRLKYLEGFI